jgi:transposase
MEKRNQVKEVSMDMARNMGLAIKSCFPNAKRVIDRFHVVKLVLDALQHLRVKYRWKAIADENAAHKTAKESGLKYYPEVFSNGDSIKELLARSRYLLYKLEDDWTMKQAQRAAILFEKYPLLKTAYKLTLFFRSIYKSTSKENARIMFDNWKQRIIETNIEEFNSTVFSIEYYIDNILNFFDHYSTNAYAESFNSKIKGFRENLRGVSDVKFFLFRLSKLFA